jgi:cell division protein FtsL
MHIIYIFYNCFTIAKEDLEELRKQQQKDMKKLTEQVEESQIGHKEKVAKVARERDSLKEVWVWIII